MQTTFLSTLVRPTGSGGSAPTPGPVATVCADVTHTSENADAVLELRIRAVTERLAELGAPAAVSSAVAERLLEGNDDGRAGTLRGRAVVTDAAGTVLLDHALTGAPLREVVDYSPLPDLLPVLRQLPEQVPHVVVVTDRVGADLDLVGAPDAADAAATPEHRTTESVDGETAYVQKVHAGGWSELRYQHSTEDVWRRNAENVAGELTRRARELGARFVLVAGDERSRQLLVERLPKDVAERVVTTDAGGRAAGADRDRIHEVEAGLVAEHLAHEDARLAERLTEGLHHGDAVTGLDAVLDAVRKGQVGTLLFAQEGLDLTVHAGSGPLELGMRAEDLAAMGIREGEVVPADRALLRAAIASGAEIAVLPQALLPNRIPVAALLRFTETPAVDLTVTDRTATTDRATTTGA